MSSRCRLMFHWLVRGGRPPLGSTIAVALLRAARGHAKSRIVAGPKQIRQAVPQAIAERESSQTRTGPMNGSAVEAHALRVAAADVVEAGELTVGDAPASAKHRLVIQSDTPRRGGVPPHTGKY